MEQVINLFDENTDWVKDKQIHVQAQSFEYSVAEVSDVSDANTYCKTISVVIF